MTRDLRKTPVPIILATLTAMAPHAPTPRISSRRSLTGSSIGQMQDHSAQIKGLLVAALLIFAVYRRLRRSFGRQRLRPVRMQVRMGLMLVIGGLLASTARLGAPYVEAIAAGLLAGIALAIWGASQTRFEREGAELYYVPH